MWRLALVLGLLGLAACSPPAATDVLPDIDGLACRGQSFGYGDAQERRYDDQGVLLYERIFEFGRPIMERERAYDTAGRLVALTVAEDGTLRDRRWTYHDSRQQVASLLDRRVSIETGNGRATLEVFGVEGRLRTVESWTWRDGEIAEHVHRTASGPETWAELPQRALVNWGVVREVNKPSWYKSDVVIDLRRDSQGRVVFAELRRDRRARFVWQGDSLASLWLFAPTDEEYRDLDAWRLDYVREFECDPARFRFEDYPAFRDASGAELSPGAVTAVDSTRSSDID